MYTPPQMLDITQEGCLFCGQDKVRQNSTEYIGTRRRFIVFTCVFCGHSWIWRWRGRKPELVEVVWKNNRWELRPREKR